jgi:hypothetical protein
LNVVTPAKVDPDVSGVLPGKEQQRMRSYEELARMPLESLLYYVLVGEGRKRSEPAGG